MIDLYYWPTPNGWKISIALEEMEFPYEVIPVNIGRGEQFQPAFLKISPNNRMPAIVDHEPPGGGEPLSIFESGAIRRSSVIAATMYGCEMVWPCPMGSGVSS